ncbi:MAG TPA: hypothetical protein VKV28_04205 [Candidatus Binataceae bacterium]|nr:hypothetical protein [Candidatus Binataceae bacterium]
MRNPIGRPLALGSVSPLQMLRGMLDMSTQWWHDGFPLLGAIRLVLLGATLWALLNLAHDPVRGAIVVAVCLPSFFVLRQR